LRCRYGNFDGNSHGDFYRDFHGDFHGDFALTQTQQPCQYNLATPLALRTPLQEQPKATAINRKQLQEQPKAPLRTEPQ
jgi:hypothetical protein